MPCWFRALEIPSWLVSTGTSLCRPFLPIPSQVSILVLNLYVWWSVPGLTGISSLQDMCLRLGKGW